MELALMSFGGYVFSINPSELEIQYERILSERVVPFCGTTSSDLGIRRRRAAGKGYFAGDGRSESFRGLEEAFASGKPQVLSVPGKAPFMAVLTSLKFIGVTADNVIGYSFSFAEADGSVYTEPLAEAAAEEGQSLWDFANKYGIGIETLAEKNRGIKFINYLEDGQKIKL